MVDGFDPLQFDDAYESSLLEPLQKARRALLLDPDSRAVPEHVTSAFCRLALVAVVATIDALIDAWAESSPSIRSLKSVWTDKNKPNAERVTALSDAFNQHGVRVEEALLRQLLAMRLLRDGVCHPEPPNQQQQRLITDQGFPADPTEPLAFTEDHWRRIWNVYSHVSGCIQQVGFADRFPNLRALLVPTGGPATEEALRLITPKDLPRLWRHNVEVASWCISTDMKATLLEPRYNQVLWRRRKPDNPPPGCLSCAPVALRRAKAMSG